MKKIIAVLNEAGIKDKVIKQVTLVDEALVLKINKRLTTPFPESSISKILQALTHHEDVNRFFYAVETTKSEGHVYLVEYDDGQYHATLESATDNESPDLIEALINTLDPDADWDDEEEEQEDPMGTGSEPKVWP